MKQVQGRATRVVRTERLALERQVEEPGLLQPGDETVWGDLTATPPKATEETEPGGCKVGR